MTSRFPISPDLCPWPWPPPIGQALCLPTRPLGSHLWTRVRQQIYTASGLIPLLEQLPLAIPGLPLSCFPGQWSLPTGQVSHLPVRPLKTLPYLQSDRQSTLPRAQFNINSLFVTSEAHQMSGFPFHQMVTSLVTFKPGSPVVAAPVAVTTGMPSCGTFWNHFENHLLMHCDTLQYHT